jgi:hypothetical protein
VNKVMAKPRFRLHSRDQLRHPVARTLVTASAEAGAIVQALAKGILLTAAASPAAARWRWALRSVVWIPAPAAAVSRSICSIVAVMQVSWV